MKMEMSEGHREEFDKYQFFDPLEMTIIELKKILT